MTLILKMEAMAGDSVETICAEMVELAERLKVSVQVKANGVTLVAHQNGNASDLYQKFQAEIISLSRMKIASTGGIRKGDLK